MQVESSKIREVKKTLQTIGAVHVRNSFHDILRSQM